MRNGKRFLKSMQGMRYQHCDHSIKMLLGVLIFAIAMLLYCMNAAASKEDGLCEHHPEHTKECGYTEENPESSCGFVCEICDKDQKESEESENPEKLEKPEKSGQTVISWSWDSDELVWNESSGLWGLGLPGVNEENKVTRKSLEDFLPREISAKMEDKSEKKLKLSWDLGGFPEEGAFEGSYTVAAGIPKGYALGDEAAALKVLVELGGGTPYLPVAPGDKFVSNWKYVSRGGSVPQESSDFKYSMDYYLAMTSDRDLLIQKIKSVLPSRISCSGYYNQDLKNAGFIPVDVNAPTDGTLKEGYVNIEWADVENIIDSAGTIKENTSLTFEAMPVSNKGYRIRVNSNDPELDDSKHPEKKDENDTAEIDGILNLTITLHDIHLEKHTVSGINPPSTKVNLFDYWVDQDGAKGDDILPKSDKQHSSTDRSHTGVQDWNKGINDGRLLLSAMGIYMLAFGTKAPGRDQLMAKLRLVCRGL